MQSVAHITRPLPANPEPLLAFGRPLQRISVDQYHRMIEAGVFSHGEKCELIRGVILEKPVPKPPHSYAVDALSDLLNKALAGLNCIVRAQQPITAGDSEPEPDVAVARGTRQDYKARHPVPAEVELLVEVADTTLRDDRTTKLKLYAEVGIGYYWIVNLVDRCIEVYAQPRGGKKPTYRKPTTYGPGDSVPVVVRGKRLGTIPVDELLP